jgi:2-dehydropantoate 2-reductase
MHYLVFGAGAVGSYIGGQLALSGQHVKFLARARIAEAFRKQGLQMLGKDSYSLLPHPQIFTRLPEAISGFSPDIILLTVKAYDVASAAEQIKQFAPPDIPILCFTNGVGNEDTLARILGSQRVIPGTLTTAVQLSADGVVHIERERGFGLAGSHTLLESIMEEFLNAGFWVKRFMDPDRMKWSKLMTNIVSNATSAIVGWQPARIFKHAGLFRLELEALRETVRVMRRLDFRPQNLPGVPVALLSIGIFLPPRMIKGLLGRVVSKGRGQKPPSLHYDIGRKRSEIGWLNGAVVSAGEKVALPTPANCILTDTMMELVQNDLEHKRFRDHPEALLKLASTSDVPGIRGYNP